MPQRVQSLATPQRNFAFLEGLDADLRAALLEALRTLWTHTSTALEGNTFTLGDTAFFLQEGLTIGGKSLREHEEIYGHAKAIELVYDLVQSPNSLNEESLFALHTLVQTQTVTDVYTPVGAWKMEPNGTYAIGGDGKSFFLEYPAPVLVPSLMKRWTAGFAEVMATPCTRANASQAFTAVHTSFVRIHPFADGNGRMARLLGNMPLLASGLPPLLIAKEARRDYIGLLGAYEQQAEPLMTADAALLPENAILEHFRAFCAEQWQSTWDEIDKVWAVQDKRGYQY
ncbi:MAG: Fic family protein [Desulfovibrionaceae bacterium]